MWKLNKPSLDSAIDDLDTVIEHCNSLNATDKPSFERVYRDYDNNGGFISDSEHDSFNDDKRNAMKGQYQKLSGDNILSFIRVDLFEGVNKCPYCGISLADTLDHFLPKSIYGELSTCRLNLIPSVVS